MALSPEDMQILNNSLGSKTPASGSPQGQQGDYFDNSAIARIQDSWAQSKQSQQKGPVSSFIDGITSIPAAMRQGTADVNQSKQDSQQAYDQGKIGFGSHLMDQGINFARGVVEPIGNAVSTGIGAVVKPGLDLAEQGLEGVFGKPNPNVQVPGQNLEKSNGAGNQIVQKIKTAYDNLPHETKQSLGNLGSLVNDLFNVSLGAEGGSLALKGGSLLKTGVKDLAEKSATTLGVGPASDAAQLGMSGGAVENTMNSARQGMVDKGIGKVAGVSPVTAGDTTALKAETATKQKIMDRIMPEPTGQNKTDILNQGRSLPNPDTLKTKVFGKPPTTILPNTFQQAQRDTAFHYFGDGFNKMDDPQAITAVGKKVEQIAKPLRAELSKVPLDGRIVTQTQKAADKILAEQSKNPLYTDTKGVKTLQKNFRDIVDGLGNTEKDAKGNIIAKTGSDAWDARIKLDKSVPDSIKKARPDTPMFPIKQAWQEVRGTLNDLIHTTGDQLPTNASRQSFKDMSNLYEIKNTLLSKAELQAEATPGLIHKASKHLGKAALGAGGISAYELLK